MEKVTINKADLEAIIRLNDDYKAENEAQKEKLDRIKDALFWLKNTLKLDLLKKAKGINDVLQHLDAHILEGGVRNIIFQVMTGNLKPSLDMLKFDYKELENKASVITEIYGEGETGK